MYERGQPEKASSVELLPQQKLGASSILTLQALSRMMNKNMPVVIKTDWIKLVSSNQTEPDSTDWIIQRNETLPLESEHLRTLINFYRQASVLALCERF